MKLDFAINVQLKDFELDSCVFTTEADQKMRLGRLSLLVSKAQLNAFVKKVVLAEMLQPSESGLNTSEGEASSELSWAESNPQSEGSWMEQFEGPTSPVKESWPTDPTCFTCGKVGHVAKDCRILDVPEETPIQYLGGKGTNCENCGMYGHDQAHCNPLFIEEE